MLPGFQPPTTRFAASGAVPLPCARPPADDTALLVALLVAALAIALIALAGALLAGGRRLVRDAVDFVRLVTGLDGLCHEAPVNREGDHSHTIIQCFVEIIDLEPGGIHDDHLIAA